MKTKIVMLIALSLSLFGSNLKAQEIDEIVICSGLVIGNANIDYFLGSQQASYDAFKIAYTAEFASTVNIPGTSERFSLRRDNVMKVINAYNSESYDSNLYEEVVGCYRLLASVLLKPEIQYYLLTPEGANEIKTVTEQAFELLKKQYE